MSPVSQRNAEDIQIQDIIIIFLETIMFQTVKKPAASRTVKKHRSKGPYGMVVSGKNHYSLSMWSDTFLRSKWQNRGKA